MYGIKVFFCRAALVLIHGKATREAINSDEKPLNREVVLNPNKSMLNSSRCLPFKDTFGFILCWLKNYPENFSSINPVFLLDGPVTYSLDLRKIDPTLTSYKFRYEWANDDRVNAILIY